MEDGCWVVEIRVETGLEAGGPRDGADGGRVLANIELSSCGENDRNSLDSILGRYCEAIFMAGAINISIVERWDLQALKRETTAELLRRHDGELDVRTAKMIGTTLWAARIHNATSSELRIGACIEMRSAWAGLSLFQGNMH